jgi:hypothetical protein
MGFSPAYGGVSNARLLSIESSISELQSLDGSLIRSSFRGLNTYTTNDNTVVIQSGECGSDGGQSHISVTADLTLVMSSSTIDSGASELANTWYYIWIFRATSGTGVTARYSTSNSSPTVPGGYSAKRLIGAVRNDASSDFRPFRCDGAGMDKRYTYNKESLTMQNQYISSRTAITVTNEVPILPVTGYPSPQVAFEFTGTSLRMFNQNESVSFVFVP